MIYSFIFMIRISADTEFVRSRSQFILEKCNVLAEHEFGYFVL